MIFNKIEELAKAKGVSVAKVERRIGLGNGTIQKWRKKENPELKTVILIADYFGVPLNDLIKDFAEYVLANKDE